MEDTLSQPSTGHQNDSFLEELHKEIVRQSKMLDLQSLTRKQFRQILEEHFQKDLSDKKELIYTWANEITLKNSEASTNGQHNIEASSKESDLQLAERLQQEERESVKRPKRSTAVVMKKRKDMDGKSLKLPKSVLRGFPECRLTPEMSEFMHGKEKSTSANITRTVWSYIKEHNLQNPHDKRQIICDSTLKSLFKLDKIQMLRLPGAIQRHLIRDYE